MSDGLGGHSSPGGSSSGSGISVAAGFAPIAIGTETEGSLISPSTRQSLYTIKPTLGTVPNTGIMPVSIYLDVPGPMCRSVRDTADLLTVLAGKDHPNIPADGFNSAMKGAEGWKSLKVGTLDPVKFRYDSSLQTPIPEAIEQIHQATLEGYERIKTLAQSYHGYVELRPHQDFDIDGKNSFVELMVADFEDDFNEYLKGMKNTNIGSAKELAEWNRAHADLVLPSEYPNQDFIDQSIAFDHMSHRRQELMDHITAVGKSLPDAMAKYNLDVVIGPADSWFSKYSAATGYPLCSLPLAYIAYNGRPVGLEAMARSEATLVTLMSAFEATFPQRKPPTAYLARKSTDNA
jgi:amidase